MKKIKNPMVDRLMASAKDLFFKFGIRRVSVTEICREAGVSKMSFYRHFKDKEDIAIKVLEMFFDMRINIFESVLQENIAFENKLRKIADIKSAQLKITSNELVRDIVAQRESSLGKVLMDLKDRQVRRTREMFVSFQSEGHIRKDIKVDLIMYILEHLWGAVQDEKLLAVYDDKSQLLKEMFRAIYYGILPPGSASETSGSGKN